MAGTRGSDMRTADDMVGYQEKRAKYQKAVSDNAMEAVKKLWDMANTVKDGDETSDNEFIEQVAKVQELLPKPEAYDEEGMYAEPLSGMLFDELKKDDCFQTGEGDHPPCGVSGNAATPGQEPANVDSASFGKPITWDNSFGIKIPQDKHPATANVKATCASDWFYKPEQLHPTSAAFKRVLDEVWAMHNRKSADYGTTGDPFANVRASSDFGVPAWLGAVIRGNDKVTRLKTFAQKGVLKNESVEDSLLDLAVYSMIALVLFREQQACKV